LGIYAVSVEVRRATSLAVVSPICAIAVDAMTAEQTADCGSDG
jgi:hypothetical protein